MVHRCPILALTAILTLVAVSHAVGSEPASSQLTLDPVNPELKLHYFGYTQNSTKEDRNHFVEGALLVPVSGGYGDGLQYLLSPQFRFDSADKTAEALEFVERDPQRPALTFQEAFVAGYGERIEVVAGKKLFSWGVADGYKPTDNINPYDSLDVPTAEKIGVPAVSVFRYGRWVDAQVVWVPVFTPSRVPEEPDQRWAVQDTSRLERVTRTFGQPPTVEYLGRELPTDELESSQAAVKLSSSTLAPGWDLAVSYYRGFYPIGVLESRVEPPSADGQRPPNVVVRKVYPRAQEFGASLSTTLGDWEFHAEGAFHLTDEEEEDDDYWEYIGGATVTFSEVPTVLIEEIWVTLEYAGITYTRRRPDDSAFSDAGFGRGLSNTVLGRLTFKASEDTRVEFAGAYNFNDRDCFAEGVVTHKLVDWLSIDAGYQLLEGPEGSFFGEWDDNDRFFVTATSYF
jgi:hypothetical protein